jgi:hypothetical protein
VRALRWQRRRAAAFTVVVLVASLLLLAIGGAFVDATTNVVKLEGLRDRQEVAKEALAGAAEWARSDVARWPAEMKERTGVLALSRSEVKVSLTRAGEGFEGKATATAKPDVVLGAKFAIERRGDRWAVVRFELKTAP